MRSRSSWTMVLVLLLAGCANPPGTPEPKPLDYQEEAQAISVYRKYAPHLQAVEGVESSYLTKHNNPRRIVVVVKNDAVAEAVRQKYGRNLEGIKLWFQEVGKDSFLEGEDGPIEEVAKLEQPKTWWDQVVFFLREMKSRWFKAG